MWLHHLLAFLAFLLLHAKGLGGFALNASRLCKTPCVYKEIALTFVPESTRTVLHSSSSEAKASALGVTEADPEAEALIVKAASSGGHRGHRAAVCCCSTAA